MDANLNKIAKDLYGKIQTRFKNINIGDENAEVLSKKEDIPRARFFEFEYVEDGESLGTIAITLDAEDGIVMQVSGDLVDDESKSTRNRAYQFIRGFRQFAKDRLLNFDVQNIGKSNLDKRDYEFQAKRKEMPIMPSIMESKLYGNNRMSYQDLGETRLIIKHSQPINVDLPAGRTMHIEGIYIENNQGERFKYPFRHINGARALAEHIAHGGNPYDNIGQYICNLSEELAGLRKFKGYVSRQEQLSEAMEGVTVRVVDRIEEIKETISKLQKTSYYESFVESFQDPDEVIIPEDIQNDLIDRLTIRTFNEELKSVFPYIYKFIDESELPVVEISADDILGEEKDNCGVCDKPVDDCECDGHDHKNESFQPEDQFESFLESLVSENKNEILSPNEGARSAALDKLNDIISQNLQVGPNGDNAIMTLKGLIDEPAFVDAVKAVPAETDLNDIIKGWVETEHEDLLSQLRFPADKDIMNEPSIQSEPSPQPTPPAPPAQAAAAPVAEPAPEEMPAAPAGTPPAPAAQPAPMAEEKQKGVDGKACWKGYKRMGTKQKGGKTVDNCVPMEGIVSLIRKAKDKGATLETMVGESTLGDLIEACGMEPADFGFEAPQLGGLEGMLHFISGFYNKEEGNFPLGGMRIKIKVKKEFEDGAFGGASEDDLIKVLKFIDKKDPSGNTDSVIGSKDNHAAVVCKPVDSLEAQVQEMVPRFNESTDDIAQLKSFMKRMGI